MGEVVDTWALALPSFAALRARPAAVHRATTVAGECRRALAVQSCLSRQTLDALPRGVEIALIDTEPEVLAGVAASPPRTLRTVRENVLHLADGLGRVPLPPQDLIVCFDLL